MAERQVKRIATEGKRVSMAERQMKPIASEGKLGRYGRRTGETNSNRRPKSQGHGQKRET